MSLLNAKLCLIIGSACLMTACGGTEVSDLKDKASQVQDLAGKAGKAKDLLANAGPLKDKVLGMKEGVSQTLTSVKSGDFAAAQENFGTLQASWGEIEGDIKNLSAESHSNIQTGIETVETNLNAASPDGDKIAQNLESLTGSIGGLTGDSTSAQDNVAERVGPENSADGAVATGGGDLGEDSVASNLSAMKSALADTTTAVESADFGAAKTAFADARQSWFKFGGSIKQDSAETYQSIDEGIKTVNSTINSADPAAETLLGDLGSLSKSLNEVTP